MRKFLSQVVAMLLVALMAAPAAMAQGERASMPLAKMTSGSGKAAMDGGFALPQAKKAGQAAVAGLHKAATADDVRAYFNRKNAPGFAPCYAQGSKTFNGVVVAFDGMMDDASEIQMNEFSAQAPFSSEQVSLWSLMYGCNYGTVMGEEYYYVVDALIMDGQPYAEGGLAIDPATWEVVSTVELGDDYSYLLFAAAYDPVTGNIYANSFKPDGSGPQFGIFDPATFTTSHIADLEDAYMAFACSIDGTLYAMNKNAQFGTIDKATGEFTVIKSTGLTSQYITSGAINYMAEKPTFYWATCNDEGSDLYSIDLATGNHTLVYTFDNGQEIRGMFFERPLAEPAAPAKPALGAIDFEGPALGGDVTFTAPATLYNKDKAPAGQKLRYEIIANGQVLQSGSGLDYGHTYKVKAEVAAPGLYTFNVIVYNEAGPSPKSNTVTLWIGPDSPAKAKNVRAAWAADKMTVSWSAVSAGAHSGHIGNVTYALYNAADSTLIKDAITATSYSIDLKAPVKYTEYQYYVVAISDGEESEPALSNMVALGDFAAPFTTAINRSATPNWTIIDGNMDRKTWSLTADQARYTYHSKNVGDDWLISSPIIVEPGYVYTVTVDAASGASSWAERMEVKAGAAPTAQAMTIDVVEATDVNTTDFKGYSGKFLATTDKVYIGIHAISEPDRLRLSVNRLTIDAGVNGSCPDASTDLNVAVPYSGENKATLSYTAPTTTLAGDELAGDKALTRVEVLVNGELEYVDNNPTAGAMSSIEISVPAFGVYDFKVIAYNKAGEGQAAEISAYVGINVPADVAQATVTEVSDGVVNISWDAVTTDADGNVMNPALIAYTVASVDFDEEGKPFVVKVIAENIAETSVSGVKAADEGTQQIVQYAIFAISEAGMSKGHVTDAIFVGTPFALPYTENFANGRLVHDYLVGGAGISIFGDDSGIVSRNEDNGFIGFQGQQWLWGLLPGSYSELISGKIAVTEKEPELSFYYFCFGEDNENTITTYIIADGERTQVDEVVTAGDNEWKRAAIDLKAFAGKSVQFAIRSSYNKYVMGNVFCGFVDDIRLGDPVKVDLVARNISAPATISTEQQFKIDYTVSNQGLEEAKDVYVSLYANGNLVESSVDTLTIAAGATVSGTFAQQPFTLFEDGVYEFSYVVDCEADQDLTNNASKLARVKVVNSNLPALQLSGSENTVKEDSTATITLSWDTPAIDISYAPNVEGFESASYPSFTTESFAGWTILNFNTTGTYPINGVNFPGSGTAFGWILWNNYDLGSPAGYEAYEGSSCMAAFAHKSGANDAWLISPAQLGAAQTVTFMARCLNDKYGSETMECYYSTTGTDVADFTKVAIQGYDENKGVTLNWVKYSIDLPAGAKYFAIRSTANDCFMLQIDNVSYLGISPFVDLELKGYDVYRNQVKINSALVTAEEYTDVVKQNGTYDYAVVAVYNEGNSAPSNVYSATVDFTQDGIDDAVAGANVAVEGREIVVTGAERVAIAAVDGKLVYAGQSARVAVAAGVYVVKADNTVAKVVVK